MLKRNRVLGLIIISCDKTSWNSNFEGSPNKCLDEFVASTYCLKFAYRVYLLYLRLPVFFRRRFIEKLEKGVLQIIPKSLDDTLSDILIEEFGKDAIDILERSTKAGKSTVKADEQIISHKEIQNFLFTFIDIALFGGAFATTLFTKSFTGAVQFGYGVNQYDGAEVVRSRNLSPFQNSNKKDSQQTTIGTHSYLSEGHFVYDFVVNPFVNEAYREIDPNFRGLTEEDYQAFKDASLKCVNHLQSVSKKGCYNEFAMFVELKEGSKKYLGNLNKKVKYTKSEDGKGVIDLSLIEKDLNCIMDDITSIEIYHNPVDTTVLFKDNAKVSVKNIIDEEVVDFTSL